MRITINYFEGYPELEAELAKFSPRARAERFRLLATMGLSAMQDGRSHITSPAVLPGTSAAASPKAMAMTEEAASTITKNVFSQVE